MSHHNFLLFLRSYQSSLTVLYCYVGAFDPITLMVKDIDGKIHSEHKWDIGSMHQCYVVF